MRIWKLNQGVTHRTQTEVQVLEHSNNVVWLEYVMRMFDGDSKIYVNTEQEVMLIKLAQPIIKRNIVIREID